MAAAAQLCAFVPGPGCPAALAEPSPSFRRALQTDFSELSDCPVCQRPAASRRQSKPAFSESACRPQLRRLGRALHKLSFLAARLCAKAVPCDRPAWYNADRRIAGLLESVGSGLLSRGAGFLRARVSAPDKSDTVSLRRSDFDCSMGRLTAAFRRRHRAKPLADAACRTVGKIVRRRSFRRTLATSITLVTLGILAFWYVPRPGCVEVSGRNELAIRLNKILPGTARFFCYRDDAGRKLRFILARADDGKVHAAFDACRRCYAAHEGYTASGGRLVCRRCGNAYRIGQMAKGMASCVPVGLKMKQQGERAEIEVSDLEAKRGLF